MLITKTCYIDVQGMGRLPVQDGAEIKFGDPKREAVMGDEGVLGHTEEFTDPPMITCKLKDTSALDKDYLRKFTGGTVTLNTNNGQQFTLVNAWVSNPLELKIKDGELDVEFTGFELIQMQ